MCQANTTFWQTENPEPLFRIENDLCGQKSRRGDLYYCFQLKTGSYRRDFNNKICQSSFRQFYSKEFLQKLQKARRCLQDGLHRIKERYGQLITSLEESIIESTSFLDIVLRADFPRCSSFQSRIGNSNKVGTQVDCNH